MNGDHETLREAAIALRREGKSRRQIREALGIRGNSVLDRLLQGEPPPEWTRRPRAKDDLQAKARELRTQGKNYTEIAAELRVSRSSVSLWVRDLPQPAPRMTQEEHARHMNEVRWEPERRRREVERQTTKQIAASQVGELSDRELLLIGAVLYWAEGAKDKPHARREAVDFINSDPTVVRVFLRWLDLLRVEPALRRFRLSIHETADATRAHQFWADVIGIDVSDFANPVIKRHRPRTVRKNTGDTYYGCLIIRVLGSADLYRRIEGWWSGIVAGAVGRTAV